VQPQYACGTVVPSASTAVSCLACVEPYYDLDQLASTPCVPCPGEISTYYGRTRGFGY
jgi:hypothetical protein